MSSTYGIAYVRPGLTMPWYAPKRVFTPTEFAGIVLNPNSSVNNVIAIPTQATTPSNSRNGLIGRCSATSSFGIRSLLIQNLPSSASFQFVDTFRPNCDETGPAIGGSAGENIYQHELATLKVQRERTAKTDFRSV